MTSQRTTDYESETIAVRRDEQFDKTAVEGFLRDRFELPDDPLEVEQFGSGHSNLTYLLRIDGHEFVLRRPPLGPVLATAHDMQREFRVLSALADTPVPSPRPFAFCDDPSLIGVPFYIMERLQGFVVGRTKALELATVDRLSAMAFGLTEAIATLHTLDYEAAGLGDFGRPDGFVDRQIERWRKQWLAAKTREMNEIEELDAWLREHRPATSRNAVVHGDVSPTNAMFDSHNPRRVVALLDWEMSTLGDPLCDLGYFLAMWPEAGDEGPRRDITPDHLRMDGAPTRAALAAHYQSRTGFEIADIRFYEVLALYKLAIILEGIYSRYKKGQTKDARFADIGERRMPQTARAAHAAAFAP